MNLDVVLPTYNRAALLERTLNSLARATVPPGLSVNVFVIDNNSKDTTADFVKSLQPRFPIPLHYVLEKVQGSSAALNAGIRAGNAELIAMINDDEEVAPDWFDVIAAKFSADSLDFIGGPYIPNWGGEKPGWIAKEFGGIVGWVDAGPDERSYGPGFDAMLMGGNAIVKRLVFDTVGLYNANLGRTDKGLLACEDDEMYRRIMSAGFKGKYVPGLIIYHYIPPERMTRSYHRRWCWGRGTSLGIMSRSREATVQEIFGIPRWEIRSAVEGAWLAFKGFARLGSPERAFEGELRIWNLAGYINGRFFHRT